MKKFTLIFTLGLFVSLVGIMSCGDGGSDEDRQKAIQDSIREADSLAALDAARLADSIAAADSARIADSLAALEEDGTPGKKPTTNNTTSNDGGDDKPVVEDPKPSTVNTNPGKPGKDDRGGDNTGKPSKGDRNNTGDGDGKTGTSKPGKRDR